MDSHVALLLGLAALGLGPLLAGGLSRSPRLHAALDGFVLCIVAGLCLAVLLPHALVSLIARPLLGCDDRPSIHLLEAVRVEREPDDLVDQPFAIAARELSAELLLERGHELAVDRTNDGFNGGHVVLLRCGTAMPDPSMR